LIPVSFFMTLSICDFISPTLIDIKSRFCWRVFLVFPWLDFTKQVQKKHFLTMLYAIFLQNGLSMDISTTASSGSRASFNETNFKRKYNNVFKGNGYYSPRKRLKINNHVLDDLTAKTEQAFKRSYLFKPGKQEQDKHFNQTFCGLYGAYRGSENLVDKVSFDLAKALPNYRDISETTYHIDDTLDTAIEVTKHLPTEALIAELQTILEEKYGLQEELLKAFQSNGKKLNEGLKLQDRDTWITEFRNLDERLTIDFIIDIPISILTTAFPRTVETLQEIMENLLKSEWLKEDIAGVKTYLNENNYIDRPIQIEAIQQAIALWTTAKYQAEKEKLKDKKHWEKVKDDMLGVAISGGLSYATANPSFIIGKLSQFTVNRIADKSDPHGQDKGIQSLKALAGAGLGGVMGGNPWDLGTALGVDLLDVSTEDPNEERSAIRGLGSSILKGVLTEDKKKLITHFLCGATAEVARKLPENDENTPLNVRITRALLSNSDVHAYYVKQWVDQRFKAPEEQAKFPTQQPTALDLEIKKAHDELLKKQYLLEKSINYLNDRERDYDRKYHKDKPYSIFKGAIKDYNNALAERDAAANKLYELSGDRTRVNTKPLKIPKRASTWEKTRLWLKANVSASGEVTIGSVPLYQTKTPNTSDRTIPPHQTKTPNTSDRSIPPHQTQERPKPTLDTPQKPTTQYSANMGQWEGVQEQQTQQIFHMNMAYRSPSIEPKLEPRLLQAGFAPSNKDALAMTGALPFAVSKLVPQETKTKIKTWIKNYCNQTVQELKANPLKAQKDQYVAMILGAKKGIVVMIQAFEQPSLKQNLHGFGLEDLSNRCDHWVAGKLNVDLGSNHAKLGMFVGEFFAPMGMISEAKVTAKTGQEALHFLKAIKKPSPLTDRALMPNAVYHSGFHPMGEMFHLNPTLSAKELNGLKDLSKTIQAPKTINRSKNCQVLIWSENGAVRTAPIREMSHAGTFHDRGGISKAGRALDKHGQRVDTVFPKAVGSVHEKNVQGQKILDEILNHPDKQIILDKAPRSKQLVIDVFHPNGHGARFSRDGKEFITFLEPNK
jgi:hypothetical protein